MINSDSSTFVLEARTRRARREGTARFFIEFGIMCTSTYVWIEMCVKSIQRKGEECGKGTL